ncbi:hypothetical protein TREMEDRAFT_59974 [Tremella mesenterica DSM 1558]|uniref:uncharacterized protein n=1 Tax=Tremella mesenterica (strain ATCC 24925 / CBS 8224 / DSM 1558 / NBRC 9311 / NRRL Y-6157 / RJB 2259-6 / UBC 559-6) TaxID=578456 RepID=UPI0003F49D34|nr:uncharacterized protein TREMEDRAFT_59974 [Tremella mesenterica DSM 1558]EIW71029.1 hypothetical protein TREMEDRAFT_59974 [Tremella mesenterica DSM 1558]
MPSLHDTNTITIMRRPLFHGLCLDDQSKRGHITTHHLSLPNRPELSFRWKNGRGLLDVPTCNMEYEQCVSASLDSRDRMIDKVEPALGDPIGKVETVWSLRFEVWTVINIAGSTCLGDEADQLQE